MSDQAFFPQRYVERRELDRQRTEDCKSPDSNEESLIVAMDHYRRNNIAFLFLREYRFSFSNRH